MRWPLARTGCGCTTRHFFSTTNGALWGLSEIRLDLPVTTMQQQFLRPSVSLWCQFGSIAVHVEEKLSPHGHVFDKAALQALLPDQKLTGWLAEMDKCGLLPKKRR